MKCKVSLFSWHIKQTICSILFSIEYVIQQSTAGTASAQLSNEKIEFIRKLGLSAKENMSFTTFGNDVNETQ